MAADPQADVDRAERSGDAADDLGGALDGADAAAGADVGVHVADLRVDGADAFLHGALDLVDASTQAAARGASASASRACTALIRQAGAARGPPPKSGGPTGTATWGTGWSWP